MPEDTNPAPVPAVAAPPVLDPAAHNAEVAAKLAAQDAAGHSTAGKPSDFEPVASALDKLAEEASKKAAATPPVIEPTAPPAEPTPEQAEAAKKAAEDQAAAAAKAEADKSATARADEVFKDVPQLPQGTSTKARESFDAIKVRAAQEVMARDQQIEQLNAKVKEMETRMSTPTTEQLEKDKELGAMRERLAKLDIQFDPKFKGFDQKLSANHEFIYAQLRRNPAVSEEVINEIKKFGGPEQCNLAKLFESMKDPTLQRIVESKIADAAMLRHEKEQAMKSTEQNLSEYLKQREETYKNAVTAHTQNTQQHLNPMLNALPWMSPKADDPAGKEFVEKIKGEVAQALQDDSPQMRAILLAGYAQMCHLQNVTKAQEADLAKAKAELADITEKYTKVKSSSTSRLRESAASPGQPNPAPKPANQFTTPAADALDTIAKQVMEQRAQAAIK